MKACKRLAVLFTVCLLCATAFAGCEKNSGFGNINIGNMTFRYAELKITSATEVSLYKGETYTLTYTVKTGGVTISGQTLSGKNVGVYNRDAQMFVATGIGQYRLTAKATINSKESATVTINVVEQASGGGTVQPSDGIVFAKSEEDGGMYAFGEMLFADGENAFWAERTLKQRFGMEGQVELSYDIADDGLYFYARVFDGTLYKGKGSGEKKIEDSDRLEIHLDTQFDGGDKPKADDYRVRIACDGSYDVSVGTGTDWKVNPNFKLDAVKVAKIGGDEMGTITERGTSGVASARDTDSGYELKAFLSYKNFGFSKQEAYGITVAQADFADANGDQRFNAAGDVNIPSHFRPMSRYGIGTQSPLAEQIDGYKSSFYDDAQKFTVDGLSYGLVSVNGPVTCETYVKCADDGVYILVQTSQDRLTYQYVTGGHTWKSDHFEVRIDSDNSGTSEAAENGDRYLHADIAGTTLVAYGITDDSRKVGQYNYVAAVRTVGQAENFSGGTSRLNTESPADIAHANDGRKHIYFELFLPYDACNIQKGKTFGLMISYGNPRANATGIGNVFNVGASTSLTVVDIYNRYSSYQKIAVPA